MAVTVTRHPDKSVKDMTFRCDAEDCGASPTDAEIIAAGGLRNMGWHCAGGRHFCPAHHPDQEN